MAKSRWRIRREQGRYVPDRFDGANDVAADRNGGFFVAEPSAAPRRVAHFDGVGNLLGQWFGGMSFYISGSFDPEDPTRLIGIAPYRTAG